MEWMNNDYFVTRKAPTHLCFMKRESYADGLVRAGTWDAVAPWSWKIQNSVTTWNNPAVLQKWIAWDEEIGNFLLRLTNQFLR